jgi:HD-GYP domain-containing protein (c-di-GMP phosphodiesterase class II)
MLRSKLIHDYQEARLTDLKPGSLVPFDLHLYFSANRHILIWRKGGEILSDGFLKKYLSRGMRNVWIHRDDLELWNRYIGSPAPSEEPINDSPAHIPFEPLAPTEQQEEAADSAPQFEFRPPEETVDPPKHEMRTDEGREINEVLASSELSERQKVGLTARAARQLIAETADASNPEKQEEVLKHARDAVRDILDTVLEAAARDVRKVIDDIWEMSALDPGMDHAVNVASFAVLFAMAFGRISADLLTDIALAALLHDVGLTQIPVEVAQKPWKNLEGRPLQLYQRHVDEGLRLLEDLAPNLSPRIRPLIQQHHEKFDGSGYPHQLQGFQINDIAQLLGMADALVSISSGQWDGKERSLFETFDELENLEKNRNYPQFFNPEVFAAVLRWIRTPGTLSNQLKASDVVRDTTSGLIKRGTG